jgi:hypothetical protein
MGNLCLDCAGHGSKFKVGKLTAANAKWSPFVGRTARLNPMGESRATPSPVETVVALISYNFELNLELETAQFR